MGLNLPLKFNLGDYMKELLKIIKFDCDLERFAEVFGDMVEQSDINGLLKVAPLTPEALDHGRTEAFYYVENSTEWQFEALCLASDFQLNICRESAGLEPADLQILRAFFCFVNDTYGWADLGDLERWETELFNSLNGYEQKNYKPLELSEDIKSRTRLFNKFIGYIAETVGKFEGVEVVRDCLDLVRDEIKGGF